MTDPMDIKNLVKAANEQLKEILSQDIIKQQQARIEELEKTLALLVFCEDAEFYPSAIEKSSPYCIDFEEWHMDAVKLLKGEKECNV